MAKKKSQLDKATDLIAKMIKEQLDTLPAAVAEKKREELHDLAIKVSRASGREKRSRPSRNGDLHRISRSRASTA